MSFPSRPRKRPSRAIPSSASSENAFRLLADPSISSDSICQIVKSDSDIALIINEAQILESQVYVERRAPFAPHRKIALKIRERRGSCFWLLLERMPTSQWGLVKGHGKTPANDLVSSGLGVSLR